MKEQDDRGKRFKIRTKLQAENNNRAGNNPCGKKNKKKSHRNTGNNTLKSGKSDILFHIVYLGEQKIDTGNKTLTHWCFAVAFPRKPGC